MSDLRFSLPRWIIALPCAFVAFTTVRAAETTKEIALRGPEVLKLDWGTRSLQAVDLNGDGLLDLAVANNDRSAIEILYQLKPGTKPDHAPKTVRPNRWEPVIEDARFKKDSITTGVTVFDLASGDLDGDGRADLVYTGEPHALTIRYQQADRTWKEKRITEALQPIQFVGSLKVADINGDKRNDLLVMAQKELVLFHQEKSGQLGSPERYALPDDGCYGLEVCDVNGDGRVDLVYLCSNTRDALRLRLQTGERQFGPEQAYTIKPTRCTLQILEQGDGKRGPLFAFAQDVTGQMEEFRLEPATAEEATVKLRPRVFSPRPGSKSPASYAVADFNGDSRLDVAVSDPDGAQVSIYFRQKDGGFTQSKQFPVFADARSIAAGDWDGDGRIDLFVASPKELAVGVASVTADGRLGYPQPLPLSGKPTGLAAGDLTGDGRVEVVVAREDKGKRFVEILGRQGDTGTVLRSVELTGLKTDPRAVRVVDANQDGKLDIAVFTPLDAMRLLVQEKDFQFTDLSGTSGYRRGLVDNLDAAAFAFGDLENDGKPEMLVSGSGFARALRINEKRELVVVDQFNARDPSAEIATALVLPRNGGKGRDVILYDKKGDQFQLLRSNEQNLYQVVDLIPAGKIDVVATEVYALPGGGVEAFVFGKDRFWWLPLTQRDFSPTTVRTYATDLPEISYGDVIAGDLNADDKLEVLCVDPNKNLVEVLSRGADQSWESRLHFKVFETDQHFRGRKGNQMEPRETIVADVTGDKKKDLVLLVHDRVLIYPQE